MNSKHGMHTSLSGFIPNPQHREHHSSHNRTCFCRCSASRLGPICSTLFRIQCCLKRCADISPMQWVKSANCSTWPHLWSLNDPQRDQQRLRSFRLERSTRFTRMLRCIRRRSLRGMRRPHTAEPAGSALPLLWHSASQFNPASSAASSSTIELWKPREVKTKKEPEW